MLTKKVKTNLYAIARLLPKQLHLIQRLSQIIELNLKKKVTQFMNLN